MQTIDEADYDIEVRKQARQLAEVAEEYGDEPVQLVVDVLDAHSWFDGEELTGADYGAIVADFSHYNGNPENYRDPSTITEGGDFCAILRKMAFAEFEADVLACYQLDDYE